MNLQGLCQLVERLPAHRILVLGDIMLDRYTWGDAERISPEAPVPVLRVDSEDVRLGGAGSVAWLLRGLNVDVALAGVIGADRDGHTTRTLLDEDAIARDAVCTVDDRPTTSKQRLVGRAAGRHAHQMVRIDREVREPVDAATEHLLIDGVTRQLPNCSALLISDYAKGVCTSRVLSAAIESAVSAGIPVVVDPARIHDYARYRNATVLTPNRSEAEMATGCGIVTPEDALLAASRLCEVCNAHAVAVTLDRDGVALVDRDGCREVFPTQAREVYDITGAGDMVLAIIGLGQACGLPLPDTVRLANIAAGLEIAQFGVHPVSWQTILAEVSQRPHSDCHKLITLGELQQLTDTYRRNGKTIVLTNGCFDLLHVGHLTCLREAARQGDVLIVAINSDQSIARLKGIGRPVVKQLDRAVVLAALECVDHVLVFDEDTPHALLRLLRPDVLVKGGTYRSEEVVGREIVEAYGGRVHVTSVSPEVSTTRILAAAAQNAGFVEPSPLNRVTERHTHCASG